MDWLNDGTTLSPVSLSNKEDHCPNVRRYFRNLRRNQPPIQGSQSYVVMMLQHVMPTFRAEGISLEYLFSVDEKNNDSGGSRKDIDVTDLPKVHPCRLCVHCTAVCRDKYQPADLDEHVLLSVQRWKRSAAKHRRRVPWPFELDSLRQLQENEEAKSHCSVHDSRSKPSQHWSSSRRFRVHLHYTNNAWWSDRFCTID